MAAVTHDAPQVTAGVYTRISLASIGDTTKTDDQERICRDLAARLGWTVAESYTDHSQSAWKRNRKRPGWDKMLADVESGRINAIVVYHGDRLVRQPWDLEKLLDLAHAKGVKLASPTGVRDLDSPDDQFILGIEANMARRESANTSRRKKAQYERMRRQGLVRTGGGGGRAFGFNTDGITQRPDEADLVREAAARILAGESARGVLTDFTTRGVRSTAGNPMALSPFRRILTMPRTAGLMPDGVTRASWDPILDRGTWETLRAVTGLPNPAAGRSSYLLSGIAKCGSCQHVLYSAFAVSVNTYRCPPGNGGCGKVRRNKTHLDAYVSAATVAYLNRDDWPDAQAPSDPGRATEYVTLTGARAELALLIADHTSGALPLLLARLASVDKRLAELAERSGDQARLDLIGRYRGITDEQFAALPLSVRRSLVSACLEITVLPAVRRGGPGFHPEYVELRRR